MTNDERKKYNQRYYEQHKQKMKSKAIKRYAENKRLAQLGNAFLKYAQFGTQEEKRFLDDAAKGK